MGCVQSSPGAKRATSYEVTDDDSPRQRATSALKMSSASPDESEVATSALASGGRTYKSFGFDPKNDNSGGGKKGGVATPISVKKKNPGPSNVDSGNLAKLDPKDFIFSKLKGETKIREPETVNGQQFIIEDCEDCILLIFDTSATITIDNCKRCCILLGPIDGSLFARNCTDCQLIVACHQFRTRECERCDVFLFCTTKPIIESSSSMRFGCFDFSYAGIEGQMSTAKMSPWVNLWSDMYDFTPAPGGVGEHWTFLPERMSSSEVLEEALKGKAAQSPTLESARDCPPVVFKTRGNRPRRAAALGEEETDCFVLFPMGPSETIHNFVAASLSKGLVLIWTNVVVLNSRQAKALFSSATDLPPPLSKKIIGKTIGVCFRGINCRVLVEATLGNFGNELGCLVLNESPVVQDYRRATID